MGMKFNDLRDSLPPLIPRSEVHRLLGGLYSAKYLANLNSMGEGPPFSKIGRKVVYRREDLIDWLEEKAKKGEEHEEDQ